MNINVCFFVLYLMVQDPETQGKVKFDVILYFYQSEGHTSNILHRGEKTPKQNKTKNRKFLFLLILLPYKILLTEGVTRNNVHVDLGPRKPSSYRNDKLPK